MRNHIDIVSKLLETAEIIQFPGRGNSERSSMPQGVFFSGSRFILVVSKGVDIPPSESTVARRSRSLTLKLHDLSLVGLMEHFETYGVEPMEPDEMRYWKSRESQNDKGYRVIYDLHVFMNDHSPLSLEQFNTINKMIRNGYTVPLVWQKEAS